MDVLFLVNIAIQFLTAYEQDGVLIVEVGNSDRHVVETWPEVPFLWFEFERGGQGVFMLERRQLIDYRDHFTG